jgi:hypothetical protein
VISGVWLIAPRLDGQPLVVEPFSSGERFSSGAGLGAVLIRSDPATALDAPPQPRKPVTQSRRARRDLGRMRSHAEVEDQPAPRAGGPRGCAVPPATESDHTNHAMVAA